MKEVNKTIGLLLLGTGTLGSLYAAFSCAQIGRGTECAWFLLIAFLGGFAIIAVSDSNF